MKYVFSELKHGARDRLRMQSLCACDNMAKCLIKDERECQRGSLNLQDSAIDKNGGQDDLSALKS